MTKFAGKYASKTFRPKDVLPTVVVPQGPVPRASCIEPTAGKYVQGTGAAKPIPHYTGDKVVGIAVMHKSSLQPVFSQREAEESAKMRRG